jgi:DNA modification methylase
MIPTEIPFSTVILGDRGRTHYHGIEDLAESIEDNGLVQPIVLAPLDGGFKLVAGGRRYHALMHLGVATLYHATTSDPAKPGFVLKGEEGSTLQNLLTEIAENLDRHELDWRDEVSLLVKAWKLAKDEAKDRAETVIMRDFGAMLGCGYAELQAAVAIASDLKAQPEKYEAVTSIRGAYSQLLKEQANEVCRLAAEKSLASIPLARPRVEAQNEPQRGDTPEILVPLHSAFRCCDALEFLGELEELNVVDHIVTDPDYGVSLDRLDSNREVSASAGVEQETPAETLILLDQFIQKSFRVLKPHGFLVFFYDLDHHEKIQSWCRAAGFAVQRWPLIWKKIDYRSNAAPAFNFCKNLEYAMVCRKPGATLVKPQMSSIYDCASASVVRDLGHPFAKPFELWTWIYNAIAIKGQVVADPFAGRGSAPIAAARFGLRPIGSEINPDHYNNLLLNLREAYTALIGPGVRFS